MGLKSFISNSRGNIALSFGLLFIPIALSAGAAVDLANANYIKTTLQAAADAAALAGGSTTGLKNKDLQELVLNYAKANGAQDAVTSLQNVEGFHNKKDGTFEVIVQGKMKTSLMALAGIKELDVGVSSTVTFGSRALEMALVLDVTGSMSRSMPTGGSRLAALKTSATKMIDILEKEKASYAVLSVAVVPFSQYVNPGSGCVGSRSSPNDVTIDGGNNYPAVTVGACPPALSPLTNNTKDVKTAIASLTPAGSTYIPAGVVWGWNALTHDAPLVEAMNKPQLAALGGFKAMVVMTDGDNKSEPQPDGTHKSVDEGVIAVVANQKTIEACNNAKADGILVYSVTFMVDKPEAQAVMNSCASSPQHSFDADNAAQLDAAFTEIGQRLSGLHIKK